MFFEITARNYQKQSAFLNILSKYTLKTKPKTKTQKSDFCVVAYRRLQFWATKF
jgi:hypothetical protein